MREIRAAWLFELHEDESCEPPAGGAWFVDTSENRRHVTIAVGAENEVADETAYWLEEGKAQ